VLKYSLILFYDIQYYPNKTRVNYTVIDFDTTELQSRHLGLERRILLCTRYAIMHGWKN